MTIDAEKTVAALLVAAGRGSRAGGGVPKQWRRLAGKTVAERTLDAFISHSRVTKIALVLHPDDLEGPLWPRHPDILTVPGGATRTESVRAGLEALETQADLVLIHDIARPLVSHDQITAVIDALSGNDGAAPGLPIHDAIWSGTDRVTGSIPRDGLFRAQTPQGFHLSAILAAHRTYNGDAADDVQIARAAGLPVAITAGDESNLKITRAEDFARAEQLIGTPMKLRFGHGYDVHRFGVGDQVTLCGINIPHSRGLQGHSDADVGMHALTDAIYGALAQGDIGRHFPPSDPQWKGAASHVFLEHAIDLARETGYRLENADVTLVCEYPKIGPHAQAMQVKLAEILQIDPGQISVKATTSERLGFTGREEGIASIATALMVGL